MIEAELPIISLGAGDDASAAAAIGASIARIGFALIADHGINQALIARAWQLTHALFALPEAEKRRYHLPDLAGARGYTPFGTEIAKGAALHDLKEFWHIGRESAGDLPANIWPDRPQDFVATFTALFAAFDRVGAVLLTHIAHYLGLPRDWFTPVIAGGNSVLRLLHYPPVPSGTSGAERAAAHEDINLLTLLLGAEESGLELLDREGNWRALALPAGVLVVNSGDMLERLSNHVIPSTTHRVSNPRPQRRHLSRHSMPFFLHPRSDFLIETLPGCITPGNPNRYPAPITANDWLDQRLCEIGLKS